MTHTPLFHAALAVWLTAAAPTLAEIPGITFTDGVISPQQIEIPANAAVTLRVRNAGTSAAEFESKKLHIEQVVAPGAEISLQLQPLPAGRYDFVEEFHETLDTARGTIVAR